MVKKTKVCIKLSAIRKNAYERPLGPNESLDTPSGCFSKGYAIAMNRGRKNVRGIVHNAPIVQGLKTLKKDLSQHNLDTLRAAAVKHRLPGKKNIADTRMLLRNKGINKIALLTGKGKCSA